MRDGQIIEEVSIDKSKSMILLGREEGDIVLGNPFCSREHAILQIKEGGKVFLYDLASK